MAESERKHEGDICDNFSDFYAEYDKLDQLGRQGQYGVTHLCKRKDRDESIPHSIDDPLRMAVKIINKQRFKDSGERIYKKWRELQRNEITTLLLTRHPNIVRLYRVMEDAEYVYMIMEYLPGGELLHYITRTGKVSESKVASIIGQILRALDYMHQRDIIHLDLKPENVMLADTESDVPVVKLIDFGFASVLPRLEKMMGHRGTPYYMAPEIWNGNYDRGADVWAVGVICFVMLFGFLPFYDDHAKRGKPNTKEIKRQIRKGFTNEVKRGCGAWFPKSIPISGGARRFIEHMLRKEITTRYTVVEALTDPWCRGHAPEDTLPEVVMRGLQQFVGAATNSSRGLATVAAGVNELNSTKLESTGSFEAIYLQGGEITREEFFQSFGDRCGMRHHEMALLFDEIDQDGDGKITMDTFRMIESFHQIVAVDDRLIQLFDKMDLDGDGVLNEHDLANAIEQTPLEVRQTLDVRSLLDSVEHKEEGVIDRDEFIKALHPHHYTPILSTDREARGASEYAISLRQRSALYYDLLRQCETTQRDELLQHLGQTGDLSGRPTIGKQLTVDHALATVDESDDELEDIAASIALDQGKTDAVGSDEEFDPDQILQERQASVNKTT